MPRSPSLPSAAAPQRSGSARVRIDPVWVTLLVLACLVFVIAVGLQVWLSLASAEEVPRVDGTVRIWLGNFGVLGLLVVIVAAFVLYLAFQAVARLLQLILPAVLRSGRSLDARIGMASNKLGVI